jgi:hypothetical protein
VRNKLLLTDSSKIETKFRLIFYLTHKLELAEEKRAVSKAKEAPKDYFTLTSSELTNKFKDYFFQNE